MMSRSNHPFGVLVKALEDQVPEPPLTQDGLWIDPATTLNRCKDDLDACGLSELNEAPPSAAGHPPCGRCERQPTPTEAP